MKTGRKSARGWPVITAGIVLLVVALLLLIFSFFSKAPNHITPFRAGYISDTGRLWSTAILAAAAGTAILFAELSGLVPRKRASSRRKIVENTQDPDNTAAKSAERKNTEPYT